MHLPNPERAVVDIAKLRDYCLNADHPRGRHKARLFVAALGLVADDAAELRDIFLSAIDSLEAIQGMSDAYGKRYTVDIPINRSGRHAMVRTAWIVKTGEDFPRLTSCFVP